MGAEGVHASAAWEESGVASSFKILYRVASAVVGEKRNYIYSKWLRSLRYGNDFFRLSDPEHYWTAYQRFVGAILDNPETKLKMAVLSDDPDVILGFAVYRGTVLDYIYVHRDQRRQGIGKALLPEGIDTITHLTTTGLSIWGTNKYGNIKFNPFA